MPLQRTPCAPAKRLFFACGVVAADLLAFFPAHALAQQTPAPSPGAMGGLTLQSVLSQNGSWSSNPLLSTDGSQSLWGSTTSPELIIKDSTPLSQALFDTKIDENVFNQSSYDSTDLHETANLSRMNQRWEVGVQANTDYDTTRTSQTTTGLSPTIARHLGFALSPNAAFSPTAADLFSLTSSLGTSSYDNSASYSNYNTFSVSPAYNHKFDPLNSGSVSIQAQRYLTTNNAPTRTDSLGPSFGWQTIFTPRFTGNASIGVQTSRQYDIGTPTGPWAWQYTFSGSLSFKGVQDTANFTATRAQTPYGNGTEALQTSLSLAENHNLTPLFSLTFNAQYVSSTYQAVTVGNLEDFSVGSAGVIYHATERLDFSANYQYRYETLTDETKIAQDHSFTVNLVYRPNMWTLVR
jgi:hypothetical protein